MAKKKKNKKGKTYVGRGVLVKSATIKGKNALIKSKPASFGSYAGCAFKISSTGKKRKMLVPMEMKQEISGEWSEHKRIGYKAKSEFNAAGLRTFTMQIIVDVQFGYKPHAIMKKLHKVCEQGKVYPLIIGTHKIGKYKWALESISEAFNLVYSHGELARATLDLTLKEYC